jgi:Kef-type K+ transport system membrane component KefB
VPFAVVIAIVKAGDFISSLYVISLAAIYVLVMIFIVKPFLKRIGDLYGSKDSIGKPVLAIFFLLLILSSYATSNWYSCPFGAFMMGSIMPDISKFE